MDLNLLNKVFTDKKIKNRVLAKYFNKSESTISLWRNNKRQPSLEEFYEIAKLLRMDIRDLFLQTKWTNEKSETYEEFSVRIKEDDK
ncbi:helix-turn-helix transcriptional regulator [Kaistella faecalis]|uniref:helix-turn-helix transcriptional regulator n=1 Tax=Kaistella faecalis TaxID=2852098 RepID=UPI001C487759|nr:helix-turn-helix transcriptional regulator [Chryseobacterium faecale]UFK97752.1 helix-turn-helix domain-containing protein [Chryseobacterium faecale]